MMCEWCKQEPAVVEVELSARSVRTKTRKRRTISVCDECRPFVPAEMEMNWRVDGEHAIAP